MHSFEHEVVEIDGALLGPSTTWQASGHLDNFSDPMIDCTACKKRFRADDGTVDPSGNCPHCGNKAWTDVRTFNLMFETNLGAMTDGSTKSIPTTRNGTINFH